MSKTVLLKYQENRKKVVIPVEKDVSDLVYLETAFRQLFHFEKQVNLVISFQRLDPEFDEFVDLEPGEELSHLEKLNVVTPVLVTPPAVSWLYVLLFIKKPCIVVKRSRCTCMYMYTYLGEGAKDPPES